VGSWGEQVLGKIASKMMVMIMLFFQSLARGRVDFDATGEHTSGVEARPRGMETAKFGHDWGAKFLFDTI
jgi:hypothetical protein